MAIDVGAIVDNALEGSFVRALDKVIQAKAAAAFAKALAAGSPFGKRLGDQIERGLRRFLQESPSSFRPRE